MTMMLELAPGVRCDHCRETLYRSTGGFRHKTGNKHCPAEPLASRAKEEVLGWGAVGLTLLAGLIGIILVIVAIGAAAPR